MLPTAAEGPKPMSRTRVVAAALLVSLSLGATGCGRTGWDFLGAMVEVAAYVAVNAIAESFHDHHYHDAYCGHEWVEYEDHPVYYYEGRWEYYDSHARAWYYYPDGVPQY
ncbi:MAG: hypothetical protein U1F43_07615 [Myxococcota bacterium]